MPLLHSFPITLCILALFYYWFAIADRYAVFLYNHLGATPFDEITTSRYWMSGLVADGAVMILYIAANWILARIIPRYQAPQWWRLWLMCAAPLAIGIPFITMTQNSPTLSFPIAIACVIVTLIGLAPGLMPGSLAAKNPADLLWLALDGIGIAAVLQMFWALDLPSRLPSVSITTAYFASFGSIIFGALWLGAMSLARARLGKPSPRAGAIFLAGACWTYLALPLAHHLFAAPAAFRYITASSNFFASNPAMQLLTWLAAAALAFGAAHFRKHLNKFSIRAFTFSF